MSNKIKCKHNVSIFAVQKTVNIIFVIIRIYWALITRNQSRTNFQIDSIREFAKPKGLSWQPTTLSWKKKIIYRLKWFEAFGTCEHFYDIFSLLNAMVRFLLTLFENWCSLCAFKWNKLCVHFGDEIWCAIEFCFSKYEHNENSINLVYQLVRLLQHISYERPYVLINFIDFQFASTAAQNTWKSAYMNQILPNMEKKTTRLYFI